MNTVLLVILCLMMMCPAIAGTKQEVEELYRPPEAQTVKLMTFLPPRVGTGQAAPMGGGGGQGCPQNVNIGSAQGQQNRIQRLDTTVVIEAPIVIQCR